MRMTFLVFMLLPLLALFYSNTAFRHQHILPDGTLIEHAHFHHAESEDSHDREDHQHTDKEFLLFALISDSPIAVDSGCLLSEVNQDKTNFIIFSKGGSFSSNNPLSYLLRAPPVHYFC